MPEEQLPKVLVTARDDAPDDKAVLETRLGVPDVQVVAMSWWAQVLIRVARTYLQSLLGFITVVGTGAAGAVGIEIPVKDFGELLWTSAGLAVAPAAISLLQNMLEILGRWDVTNPQVRA